MFYCSYNERIMKKKIAIYIRVSRADQNIENQRLTLINYSIKREYKFDKSLIKIEKGGN